MEQKITTIKFDRKVLEPFVWLGIFALFIGFVALFKGILLPFILGLAIAYLLEPVVALFARHKVPRFWAVIAILGGFVLVIAAILILIVPLISREITDLIDQLPAYIEKLRAMAAPYIGWLEGKLGDGDMAGIKDVLKGNVGKTLQAGQNVLSGIASGGMAIANFIYILVLTPMIAYFTMMEWPRITSFIDGMIPRKHYDDIKGLLSQMDVKISGFVRGQIMVATILGTSYAIALSLAGLNFGFLIGVLAGAISIIPMVGSTIGLIVALVVAWLQAGSFGYVLLIAAIFGVGQFIEGNFLTPKIMGDKVGLHPLWIIFALSAGGALLGIVGMLLSVPVAAVCGVLGGYAIKRYKESELYHD